MSFSDRLLMVLCVAAVDAGARAIAVETFHPGPIIEPVYIYQTDGRRHRYANTAIDCHTLREWRRAPLPRVA